jgi:hypothetical protein
VGWESDGFWNWDRGEFERSERGRGSCSMRYPTRQLPLTVRGSAYTVSTTASSNRRVEGILFQLTPVNRAEDGPGVQYRSTLTGRGESAGERMAAILVDVIL